MKDIYSEITNRITEQLEQGIIPWRKPWTGLSTGAISHVTGRAYSLLNQFILAKPGEYITFNQCKQEGGHVKKGAKARTVVFWKVIPREKRGADGEIVRDADGNPVAENLPVLRYFQVFHLDDCEGIAPKWAGENAPAPVQPDKAAEKVLLDYVQREGITLEHSRSDEAYYSPARDLIHLPLRDQFDGAEVYYSTAFHEATHSTGHRSRLNRSEVGGHDGFGSESYSREELVAEIGAACIMHELGLETPNTFKNSAAYVQNWLGALRNDKRLIVSAAARAEKAVKLILAEQAAAEPVQPDAEQTPAAPAAAEVAETVQPAAEQPAAEVAAETVQPAAQDAPAGVNPWEYAYFLYVMVKGSKRFQLADANSGAVGVNKIFAPRYKAKDLEAVKRMADEIAAENGCRVQIRKLDGKTVVYEAKRAARPEAA